MNHPAFSIPFTDAIRWARKRVAMLPDDYYADHHKAIRARAFTVSDIASMDQIERVRKSLTDAIADGTTFRDWQKTIKADVMHLPDYRRELIFRNAIQTSYQAGHWQGQQQVKSRMPFLMYDAINDNRTRPHHRKLDGFIAPIDDQVWNTIHPANGHNCRCGVIQLTETQAMARGWSGATPHHEGGPDKGWDYHPVNASAKMDNLLAKKLQQYKSTSPIRQKVEEVRAPEIKTIDDYIGAGKVIAAGLPNPADDVKAFTRKLQKQLDEAVGTSKVLANTPSARGTSKTVREASSYYPDAWVQAANDLGPLKVKATRGRGVHWTLKGSGAGKVRLSGYGVVPNNAGDGYILIRSGDIATAVHEYGHRVQSALPELDALFHALHYRRTNGESLRRLRDVASGNYAGSELTRQDEYLTPYQGKEYIGRGPLEVLTMTFEWLLGIGDAKTGTNVLRRRQKLIDLYEQDPELLNLALGLLFEYKP